LTNQVATSALGNAIVHKKTIPASRLTDFFPEKTEHCVDILTRYLGLTHEDRMPGPWVTFQLVNIVDNTCSNRIQVNISHKLEEVFVLIANDRLVTVLEEVSASVVAQVECDSIAREKTTHESRQGYLARTDEEMEVIGEKSPSEADGVGFLQQRGKTLDEKAPVVIVQEDITALYTSNDYMLKESLNV